MAENRKENSTNGMLIVRRIDEKLKERGETRVDLSKKTGIPPQNISAWSVRGTIPAGDVCIRIARYLGVSAEWLVEGVDEPGAAGGGTARLTGEEAALIDAFRRMGEEGRRMLLSVAAAGASASSPLEPLRGVMVARA